VIGLSTGSNMDDNLYYTVNNTTTPTVKWDQDLGNTNASLLTTTTGGIYNLRYSDSNGSNRVTGSRFPFLWNSGSDIPQYIDGT